MEFRPWASSPRPLKHGPRCADQDKRASAAVPPAQGKAARSIDSTASLPCVHDTQHDIHTPQATTYTATTTRRRITHHSLLGVGGCWLAWSSRSACSVASRSTVRAASVSPIALSRRISFAGVSL